jgi:chromate transport protein ChrA
MANCCNESLNHSILDPDERLAVLIEAISASSQASVRVVMEGVAVVLVSWLVFLSLSWDCLRTSSALNAVVDLIELMELVVASMSLAVPLSLSRRLKKLASSRLTVATYLMAASCWY